MAISSPRSSADVHEAPQRSGDPSRLLEDWSAGKIDKRLFIADFDQTVARSPRLGRFADCNMQRMHGIDFYRCEP